MSRTITGWGHGFSATPWMESDPRAKSGPEGSRRDVRKIKNAGCASRGCRHWFVVGRRTWQALASLPRKAGRRGRFLTKRFTNTRIPSRPPEAHRQPASATKTAFQAGEALPALCCASLSQDRSTRAGDSERPPVEKDAKTAAVLLGPSWSAAVPRFPGVRESNCATNSLHGELTWHQYLQDRIVGSYITSLQILASAPLRLSSKSRGRKQEGGSNGAYPARSL